MSRLSRVDRVRDASIAQAFAMRHISGSAQMIFRDLRFFDVNGRIFRTRTFVDFGPVENQKCASQDNSLR
jgi:hypothetical protein